MKVLSYRLLAKLFLGASLPMLSACGPTPGDGSGSVTPAPTPTADPAATNGFVATEGRYIRAVPATLPDCEPAIVALEWDANTLSPPPRTVRIRVSTGESDRLFVAGGSRGRAETGRWARAGSVFSLQDGATGEELERITIGGPPCGR